MSLGKERVIFHIDVNSAFLSWEAVDRIQKGQSDLREFPSVIGGERENRRGVVLARSIPAKKYGIKTGESIYSALKKYPQLVVVSPNFLLYQKYSQAMLQLVGEYSPAIEQFSIDEMFLDYTDVQLLHGDPLPTAHSIKNRIKEQLGFTVNIGISHNKLLAKMASDLEKPDQVHTIYPWEIKTKMWPLPVEDLFMVGRVTAEKLRSMGIYTIGDLAKSNQEFLRGRLKKHGSLIWDYANGLDDSAVKEDHSWEIKSVSNETTISHDVTDSEHAYKILIALSEKVAGRLRKAESTCQLVAITIKNNYFQRYSKQKKMNQSTDSTQAIIALVKELFDETWRGEPIRLLGVSLGELSKNNESWQLSFWEEKEDIKQKALDKAVDVIRAKFGPQALKRASNLGYNELLNKEAEE